MPHTWAVATTVVPVSGLIGRDFEFEEIVGLIAAHRLMVPTVMAKTYNRASLRLSVTIIGLGRVRLRAAPVCPALCRCRGPGFDRSRPARGGPRGRRPRCSPTWPAWVRAWDFEAR